MLQKPIQHCILKLLHYMLKLKNSIKSSFVFIWSSFTTYVNLQYLLIEAHTCSYQLLVQSCINQSLFSWTSSSVFFLLVPIRSSLLGFYLLPFFWSDHTTSILFVLLLPQLCSPFSLCTWVYYFWLFPSWTS